MKLSLTPDQVMDVRRRYATGRVSLDQLAKDYGVSRDAISTATQYVQGFRCPQCNSHIPDETVTSYTGRRLNALRDPKTVKAGPGRSRSITDEQRARIRARRAAGESLLAIAEDMGISKSTVGHIANGTGAYRERKQFPVFLFHVKQEIQEE